MGVVFFCPSHEGGEGAGVGFVGGGVIAFLGGDDAVETGAGCGAGALLERDGGEGVNAGGVHVCIDAVGVLGSDGADLFSGAEVEVEVEAGVEARVGVVGGDGEGRWFVCLLISDTVSSDVSTLVSSFLNRPCNRKTGG